MEEGHVPAYMPKKYVLRICKLSRSQLKRLEREDDFPLRTRIKGRVMWKTEDIADWLNHRSEMLKVMASQLLPPKGDDQAPPTAESSSAIEISL